MTREYQITLTDGNRTGIATLRLDGQCVEWLRGRDINWAVKDATSNLFWPQSASIAHVRDIPDESEGDE